MKSPKLNKDDIIEEYRANIELWKHDDILRQKRISNFLTANTILLVALGSMTAFRWGSAGLGLMFLFLSTFGFSISLLWYSVQLRNSEYIHFRRFQLRAIEKHLNNLSTFSNMYKAFDKHEQLSIATDDEIFMVSRHAKKSSTKMENKLPLFMEVFWFIVFLVGLVQIKPWLFH
jgi:hypothetical protein